MIKLEKFEAERRRISEYNKKRYQRIKADPVKWEQYKNMVRKAQKRRLATPEGRKKYNDYHREYQRTRHGFTGKRKKKIPLGNIYFPKK